MAVAQSERAEKMTGAIAIHEKQAVLEGRQIATRAFVASPART